MGEDKKISISLKNLKKLIAELKEIEIMCNDDLMKEKIYKLIETIGNMYNCKEEEVLLDVIHKKMKDARSTNLELHSNLYILYRKLKDGKISEENARRAYENYIKMQEYDKMIY